MPAIAAARLSSIALIGFQDEVYSSCVRLPQQAAG